MDVVTIGLLALLIVQQVQIWYLNKQLATTAREGFRQLNSRDSGQAAQAKRFEEMPKPKKMKPAPPKAPMSPLEELYAVGSTKDSLGNEWEVVG